jgi:hypothetical protein
MGMKEIIKNIIDRIRKAFIPPNPVPAPVKQMQDQAYPS